MSEEQKTEQAVNETPVVDTPATSAETPTETPAQTGADTAASSSDAPASTEDTRGGARRSFGGRKPYGGRKSGGFRKGSRFGDRPKPEFEQKIINISRVTRVVKGGRRLSFRVDMVIGDKKGRVGLGSGKATDTSLAIQKAFNQARKNLVYLKLTKTHSIPYPVDAKVTSSRVEMMPNKERGLVAGSTLRNVLELAGIKDVTAKVHSRSKNKLNNAKATIEALKNFEVPMSERKVEKKTSSTDHGKDRRGGRGGGFRKSEHQGRFNNQRRDSR